MLLNELHQGGIRALLSWDSSIFDNMVLPEDIELADVVDHIIYKYGDTPLMAPDPEVLKYYISRWSARRLPLWEKYKAAVEMEYNPIENYDRQEDTTRTPNITHTQTGNLADAHTGTIADAHTGTTADQHTGNVTTNNTGNTDTQRAADNSSTWENYDKNNVNLTDTTTNNLTDTRTHNDTVTKTFNDTLTKTFNNVKDVESGNERTISRIHGNIGVTTAMQMQNAYFDIIPRFDVIDYIVDDWHDEFCLLMY